MKTYAVWTPVEMLFVDCDKEPSVDERGHLVFRREDGVLVSRCAHWSAFLIQDKK
jgi:hypothetical protein